MAEGAYSNLKSSKKKLKIAVIQNGGKRQLKLKSS